MAPHSSTLAWKIPWMEEPGGLPSLGSHRVGHDLATKPPPPYWTKEKENCDSLQHFTVVELFVLKSLAFVTMKH